MKTIEEANKALVLEAFDTLFNKRDYKAAAQFWSPNYIQHSAHIAPGREGLFNLIKSAPASLRYEHGVILADKEFAIVHGRFSNIGRPRNWIAADIVRIGESNNDLFLILHWESLADRERKFGAFLKDPEWLEARRKSEEDGPVEASITNTILVPTAFSLAH